MGGDYRQPLPNQLLGNVAIRTDPRDCSNRGGGTIHSHACDEFPEPRILSKRIEVDSPSLHGSTPGSYPLRQGSQSTRPVGDVEAGAPSFQTPPGSRGPAKAKTRACGSE